MTSISPANVGVIGCGNISNIYFETAKRMDVLNVTACADLDLVRCRGQSRRAWHRTGADPGAATR